MDRPIRTNKWENALSNGESNNLDASGADAELNEAFLDLLEKSESLETTTRIISEIYESASILATDPEIYKLDTLKENNIGNIRAYEKHTYRISYLVKEEAVYIIRVRYARKEPLEY